MRSKINNRSKSGGFCRQNLGTSRPCILIYCQIVPFLPFLNPKLSLKLHQLLSWKIPNKRPIFSEKVGSVNHHGASGHPCWYHQIALHFVPEYPTIVSFYCAFCTELIMAVSHLRSATMLTVVLYRGFNRKNKTWISTCDANFFIIVCEIYQIRKCKKKEVCADIFKLARWCRQLTFVWPFSAFEV